MYYDLYAHTAQFRQKYKEVSKGKEAYVGPYVRWSW